MKLTQGLLFTIAAAFAATASAETLEIGALPAADSAVLYVAEAEGLFQKEGLDVKVVPFKSALEIGAAMRAGRLDGHFGDLMNVFTQNETGIKQKVVLTTTHTHPEQRCFGMLVSPKVKKYEKLGDLDGTSTAMSSSTIIDYLLDRMKETESLPAGAVKNLEVKQIPIRLQMLQSGQVETAMLPEPLVTLVEQKGGRVLWNDSKLDEALAIVALKAALPSPHGEEGTFAAASCRNLQDGALLDVRYRRRPAAPSHRRRSPACGRMDGSKEDDQGRPRLRGRGRALIFPQPFATCRSPFAFAAFLRVMTRPARSFGDSI